MVINKDFLIIFDDEIYLRVLQIDHINEEYIHGLNDPDINKYLVDVRRNVQTRESVKAYVISKFDNPFDILLGIFLKKGTFPPSKPI